MTETSAVVLLQVKSSVTIKQSLYCLCGWFLMVYLPFLICIWIDCRWKAEAGDVCVASFEWSCSGICKSVERMKIVHEVCSEGEDAVWNALL